MLLQGTLPSPIFVAIVGLDSALGEVAHYTELSTCTEHSTDFVYGESLNVLVGR